MKNVGGLEKMCFFIQRYFIRSKPEVILSGEKPDGKKLKDTGWKGVRLSRRGHGNRGGNLEDFWNKNSQNKYIKNNQRGVFTKTRVNR